LRNRTDMLWEVSPDAFDSLQSSTTVSVFTFIKHYQFLIAFNTHAPVLRSRDVRRALNLAIDRPEVVRRALNGHGVPSSGPIWPRFWALPTPLPTFELDPARASAMLNPGKRPARRTAGIRFTCLFASDVVQERVALEVKRQLQAVGVEMDVQAVSPDQLIDAEKNRKFDAVLTEGVSAPTVLRVHFLWESHSQGNPGGFGNATVDAAFDRVSRAADEPTYREAVSGLQQAFLDDPPGIFLAWTERVRAVSKRFVVPPLEAGRDPLATIRLWSSRDDEKYSDKN